VNDSNFLDFYQCRDENGHLFRVSSFAKKERFYFQEVYDYEGGLLPDVGPPASEPSSRSSSSPSKVHLSDSNSSDVMSAPIKRKRSISTSPKESSSEGML